ncbi:TadE-like protein [Planctomycetes bacterium CA13]|uniref:TadE-like protein n=1 Tax=Novipirellula herctigrandis TaxID=2527986 RepID=A0A5C5ZCF4_9BACT|nr:TadE-like protein [Planctomycetes bacterium CA13]
MSKTRHQSIRPSRRRGTSAVEFALIAPLMMGFTFALVEISRLNLVKQTATHATREGARVAVRPTATNDDVTARVNDELAVLGISDATVELKPSHIADAEPGAMVTVRVRVNTASLSWVPQFFNFSSPDLVAEATMRRESTN